MAKISFHGIDIYSEQIKRLGTRPNAIIKPAVYEGAAVAVEAVKSKLQATVSPDATGDLEKSLGLSTMKDDDGFVNVKIGFDGYDQKGTPNIIKAIALEKGTSKQKKTPFIRPAIKRAEPEVIKAMQKKIDKQIIKIMNERG